MGASNPCCVCIVGEKSDTPNFTPTGYRIFTRLRVTRQQPGNADRTSKSL
ncbi:MAG: hypothetical protein MUE44_32900 [Oscillatoriaceae cyanobacterium Prado104]|nr:hypothetical protein [Oscillatoriaceae cyanobacterium Prado104]